MAHESSQHLLEGLDPGRRNFLKKVLLTAYAAPFVASFGMRQMGLSEAMAQSNLCSNITLPAGQADLIISKSAPATVNAGSQITYGLFVTNCGGAVATNVSVNDPIPAGTTFVSATQTSGPTFTLHLPPVGGTGTFSATAASFAIGDEATFQLVVQVQ